MDFRVEGNEVSEEKLEERRRKALEIGWTFIPGELATEPYPHKMGKSDQVKGLYKGHVSIEQIQAYLRLDAAMDEALQKWNGWTPHQDLPYEEWRERFGTGGYFAALAEARAVITWRWAQPSIYPETGTRTLIFTSDGKRGLACTVCFFNRGRTENDIANCVVQLQTLVLQMLEEAAWKLR